MGFGRVSKESLFPNQLPPSYEPADVTDSWIRHVLEGGAVRPSDLRVRTKYLENKFDAVNSLAWEAEISGRLKSKASNIRSFAVSEALRANNSNIKFRFLVIASVEDLRKISNTDVMFQPTLKDPAHANLVCLKIPYIESEDPTIRPRISQEYLRDLSMKMQVLPESDTSF